MKFTDRTEAGRELARLLDHLRDEQIVVLGLPRGGVVVAAEVAQHLGAPLDVLLVRKLGVPYQPEVAMGAIAEGGVELLDHHVVDGLRITTDEVAEVVERERQELDRRLGLYRLGRHRVPLEGRTVVIVDDGVATGSTARAACHAARDEGAAYVVVAVPVAPVGWETTIGDAADELIAVATPEPFFSVGQFYARFLPTTDEEVVECLARCERGGRAATGPSGAGDEVLADRDAEITIPIGAIRLGGHLTIPPHPIGLVVFAHGSGSSHHSPRNRLVASVLNDAGFGTLLFDLLTWEEERQRANVFDVELLADRLVQATRWIRSDPDLRGLPVGYLGASTGSAAAMVAAAALGDGISAVVSRGGRLDLAGELLGEVDAPTLLIVGEQDEAVVRLTRRAQADLRCPHLLLLIDGATHLFDEPGTLRRAAEAARDWFTEHLAHDAPRSPGRAATAARRGSR